MNDTIFRILTIAVFLAGAAISTYHRRKADRESGEKLSLKAEGWPLTIALRLAGVVVWVSVFAYMISPAWMAWSRIDLPDWARWAGLALGVGADALAYWTFSNLGNNVSPTVVTRREHSLVTSGPYRWVRHPLYVMGLIAYLGFALLAENWFIALGAALVFIIIVIRVPKEEARLLTRFGEAYQNYMQRTGKFLPRLLP